MPLSQFIDFQVFLDFDGLTERLLPIFEHPKRRTLSFGSLFCFHIDWGFEEAKHVFFVIHAHHQIVEVPIIWFDRARALCVRVYLALREWRDGVYLIV